MTGSRTGARASAAPWKDDAAEIESAWQALADDLREKKLDETEPYRVELPGFPPVLALRLPIRLLMARGQIPDTLTPYILALAQIGNDAAKFTKVTSETRDDYERMVNAVWSGCVVAPANVPPEIVPMPAKDALFAWAGGMDAAVTTFRRSGEPARIASNREGVRPGPGAAGGDRPARGGLAVVESAPGDVLRGANGGKSAQGDAADPAAGPGTGATGPALVNGAEMDLRASRGNRTASAGRGRRAAALVAGA